MEPGETTQSITVAPGSTTNYSVIPTAADDATVTVNPALSAVDKSICLGESIELTAQVKRHRDCTAADDATVTVTALSVSVDDKSICLGESIELTAVPSGGTAPYSYHYDTEHHCSTWFHYV